MEKPELYFPRDVEWREWLDVNHLSHPQGVYLILYKLEAQIPTMRWEEAVKVALCFGWIDSTVKNLGGPKRRQYFCRRNPKSTWSKLNKTYIAELENTGLIHESGWKIIELAKETGTWTAMDDVENGVIPKSLILVDHQIMNLLIGHSSVTTYGYNVLFHEQGIGGFIFKVNNYV
jgi:uncharacterized protein YdeI (YjbR/CyaY-like superfamily)